MIFKDREHAAQTSGPKIGQVSGTETAGFRDPTGSGANGENHRRWSPR